jgi:uncharacterized phage protein gp47/JayE
MYENITFEVILQRMLDRVPNTVDKREGSIIYDALAPAAVELQLMYIEADTILTETFADTASRTYLIKRAAERGIIPSAASNAILKGTFNINVSIGSRFTLGDLNYIVTEKITDLQFKLRCETKGAEGNLHIGSLIPIDYIDGLTSAELVELLIPGEDDEDTEQLRSKYFETLESQAYGGNIADYKVKTNGLQGVGGVKVYPVWNGGGSVKLVIINSQYQKPSAELVTTVQTAIDPVVNQGQGVGLAPIGHVVTIVSVTEQIVDIESTITYQSGWSWLDVKSQVEEAIDAYFLELNQTWADNANLIVRVSQIETRLLNVTGIIDVAATSINGLQENLSLGADSIAVRGVVNG